MGGPPRIVVVVRREDDCAVECSHDFFDEGSSFGIEGGGWFIEEEEVRIVLEGEGEFEPSSHSCAVSSAWLWIFWIEADLVE